MLQKDLTEVLNIFFQKFPDLKFRYVEEDQPEDFFVPYTWTLVRRKIYWNPKFVKLPCEPTYS
jgi:hypothetical protein